MKKKYYSFFTICLLLILSSCCRDCFITNRELSSHKTFKDENNNIIFKVNSAYKAVELLMTNNIGIKSYSVKEKNILAENYQGSVKTTYVIDNSNNKSNVKFKPLENGVIGSDSAIFSNIAENKKLKLRDIRKYRMNLDNGNLYIAEELYNDMNSTLQIAQNDELQLKNNGYLLLPLSILSNINIYGWKFTGSKNDEFIENNIIKNGNYLIIHAIPGIEIEADPNSGWFAYINNGLLFIKRYNNENDEEKRVNKLLKIKVNKNNLSISMAGEKRIIPPTSSIRKKQRWSIIATDMKIAALSDAVEFFEKMEFKFKLLINRN